MYVWVFPKYACFLLTQIHFSTQAERMCTATMPHAWTTSLEVYVGHKAVPEMVWSALPTLCRALSSCTVQLPNQTMMELVRMLLILLL